MGKIFLLMIAHCIYCLGMNEPSKPKFAKSSPRIERIQGSPRIEFSPRKSQSKVSSLSCMAARVLANKTNFLTNQAKMSLLVPADVACLNEALLKEMVKPHIFPLSINESLNQKSVNHNGVCGLDFIATTKEVVSGACDGRIMFSHMNDLAVGRGYDFDPLSVSTLSVSAAEPQLEVFIGSDNGTIYRMNYAAKKLESLFKAHTGSVNRICVGNSIVATCSTDKTVKIWDKETARPLKSFESFTQAVRCIELMEEEDFLISGSSDAKLKIWNLGNTELVKEHTYPNQPRIWGLGIMKKSKRIVTALNNGRISCMDSVTLQEIAQWYGHGQTICGLSCNPDEKYFATASWDNKARLWDPRMRICAATFTGHTDWVQQVKCLLDNEVVTGSRDKTLRLWDIRKIQAMDSAEFSNVVAMAVHLKNSKSFKEPQEREALLNELLTKKP